jgi:hypothetical protein
MEETNCIVDGGQNWTKITGDNSGYPQGEGVWHGPSTYDPDDGWHKRGRDDYESIGRGDGMQVEIDWRDNETVYSGSQFGFY